MYRLNKKVAIWKPESPVNDFDGGSEARTFVCNAYAEIKFLSTTERIEAQQVVSAATLRATIRVPSVEISAGMVLVANDVDHKITGVRGIDDGEQYLELMLWVDRYAGPYR